VGYNKIVISGDTFELYEYEKNLPPYQRIRRATKVDTGRSVLGAGGGDVLSERELGKRKDNARRAKLAFERLVRSNLGGADVPAFVTLTYKENKRELGDAYGDFTSFVQALRYRFGQGFRYICVPEFQKRGAVHFHALVWGLPSELVSRERDTRFFASIWGLGFVDFYLTDGHEKISYYLAKYMSKAYVDSRLRGCKAFVASRNCLRPQTFSNLAPLWPVFDDYKLSTEAPVQERNFMTQWFGKGRYRLYKLSSQNYGHRNTGQASHSGV